MRRNSGQLYVRRWEKILKIKIPKRPELFLLGIDLRQIPGADRTLMWYMLAVARMVFAKHWKLNKIPRGIEWLNKLVFFADMDKITKN